MGNEIAERRNGQVNLHVLCPLHWQADAVFWGQPRLSWLIWSTALWNGKVAARCAMQLQFKKRGNSRSILTCARAFACVHTASPTDYVSNSILHAMPGVQAAVELCLCPLPQGSLNAVAEMGTPKLPGPFLRNEFKGNLVDPRPAGDTRARGLNRWDGTSLCS